MLSGNGAVVDALFFGEFCFSLEETTASEHFSEVLFDHLGLCV